MTLEHRVTFPVANMTPLFDVGRAVLDTHPMWDLA